MDKNHLINDSRFMAWQKKMTIRGVITIIFALIFLIVFGGLALNIESGELLPKLLFGFIGAGMFALISYSGIKVLQEASSNEIDFLGRGKIASKTRRKVVQDDSSSSPNNARVHIFVVIVGSEKFVIKVNKSNYYKYKANDDVFVFAVAGGKPRLLI